MATHAHHHSADRDDQHGQPNDHDPGHDRHQPHEHVLPHEHDQPRDRDPPRDHDQPHEHDHDHGDEHDQRDEHDHGHEHAPGLLGRLEELIKPHSHDAADSVDDALTGSEVGINAVRLSLLGLGATALVQLMIALASGSVAVLADTIHNFADASTAIPLWLAFWVSRKPANERYTYGYGRAEDLAGVFVLPIILGSAVVAAWESLRRLLDPTPIDHLGWVAAAGLLGFVGNELVAQYRIRVGQRIGSAALITDGYHARTDGLTSLAVVIGAAGVSLGFPRADPLVGLLITVAILLVLKDATIQMWRRLMDAVDPRLVERATEAARGAEGVQQVSTVRARWIGHTIHAEALIVADCELTLDEAHAIAERARHRMLHAVPKLSTVTVHVDPCAHGGEDHHAALAHHDRPAGTN